MAEEKVPQEITENDKLMAAISYPIPILAIIILLVKDMKSREFQKFHAIQSLAAGIALWVIVAILVCILSLATAFLGGCGGFIPLLLWFITLYWAYLAYQGQYFDIPIITDFIKNQGWV